MYLNAICVVCWSAGQRVGTKNLPDKQKFLRKYAFWLKFLIRQNVLAIFFELLLNVCRVRVFWPNTRHLYGIEYLFLDIGFSFDSQQISEQV